jgi:predicted nucleic acid-binding protein
MSIIANTTVLSNFAAVGQLDLLRLLYTQLHISTDVYAEIEDGALAGYAYLADVAQHVQPFNPDGWLVLTSPTAPAELARMAALPARLHRGEASSLAIAAQRGWLFLTDDRSARNVAQAQGVRISGTLGCLLRAVQQQHASIEDANQWLALMIAQGYRSPVDDLGVLLDETE